MLHIYQLFTSHHSPFTSHLSPLTSYILHLTSYILPFTQKSGHVIQGNINVINKNGG